MEAELAFSITLLIIVLSGVYFFGPWRRKRPWTINDKPPKMDAEFEADSSLVTSGDPSFQESDSSQVAYPRKMSSDEYVGTRSRKNSRKSSRSSKCGQKIGGASFDTEDVSDLIIDPRDIKPVPVGLRMPAESTDPDYVKQYVKDLRAHQEDDMTEEELQQEKEVQQQQLAEIFRLMQNSQEKFGIDSFDDIEEQMKLYAKT